MVLNVSYCQEFGYSKNKELAIEFKKMEVIGDEEKRGFNERKETVA